METNHHETNRSAGAELNRGDLVVLNSLIPTAPPASVRHWLERAHTDTYPVGQKLREALERVTRCRPTVRRADPTPTDTYSALLLVRKLAECQAEAAFEPDVKTQVAARASYEAGIKTQIVRRPQSPAWYALAAGCCIAGAAGGWLIGMQLSPAPAPTPTVIACGPAPAPPAQPAFAAACRSCQEPTPAPLAHHGAARAHWVGRPAPGTGLAIDGTVDPFGAHEPPARR